MKFTFELESFNRINFLDVTLIRRNRDIITDWYQKSIASSRMISFLSFHPLQQKRNIVFNLTDRAIGLSHVKFHDKNCKKITELLVRNGYPIEFITANIEKRKSKILHIIDSKTNNDSISVNNLIQSICLLFKSNFHIISGMLKKFNIVFIPIVIKDLTSLIKLGKDKTDKLEQMSFVYEISCSDCSATYVGETKRTLKTRINEHKKHRNENSVVSLHESEMKHSFDWKSVRILDNEHNYKKRLISEMIHIKSNSHRINRKEDVFNLSNVYFPLIRAFNF